MPATRERGEPAVKEVSREVSGVNQSGLGMRLRKAADGEGERTGCGPGPNLGEVCSAAGCGGRYSTTELGIPVDSAVLADHPVSSDKDVIDLVSRISIPYLR